MLLVYSGKGNAIPPKLTVMASLPVDGVSPGSGWFWDEVRGAGSRRFASGAGGGAARGHRAGEPDATAVLDAGPHRWIVSGSATSPTSATPDARITASTSTTTP